MAEYLLAPFATLRLMVVYTAKAAFIYAPFLLGMAVLLWLTATNRGYAGDLDYLPLYAVAFVITMALGAENSVFGSIWVEKGWQHARLYRRVLTLRATAEERKLWKDSQP